MPNLFQHPFDSRWRASSQWSLKQGQGDGYGAIHNFIVKISTKSFFSLAFVTHS
jgi:hypothetical protein